MTNEIKSVINSLINTYPNFNNEDIAALDNLTQYTEGQTFDLLTKFLYTVWYKDSNDSIIYLNQVLSIINEEEQTFFYTVTDNYIPQPLSGTINAHNEEEAYDQLVDIYTDELGVSESDLEITIKEANALNINTYNEIRTESDFRIWASEYQLNAITVEFTDQFLYVYTYGNFSKQLNLQVFSKSELLSICNKLGINQYAC